MRAAQSNNRRYTVYNISMLNKKKFETLAYLKKKKKFNCLYVIEYG